MEGERKPHARAVPLLSSVVIPAPGWANSDRAGVSATTNHTRVSAGPAGAALACIPPREFSCAYIRGVREIPLDQAPSEIAAAARAAARGQIVYLTEDGERLAAIVPPEFAAEMEDLSPDEVLELLDDLSGAPAVGESSSDTDADPGPMTD